MTVHTKTTPNKTAMAGTVTGVPTKTTAASLLKSAGVSFETIFFVVKPKGGLEFIALTAIGDRTDKTVVIEV